MRVRSSTTLEQKWWFIMCVAALSGFFSSMILRTAGLGSPENLVQFIVHVFCFMGIWRCIAFASWLALVLLKPASRLLDPATR